MSHIKAAKRHEALAAAFAHTKRTKMAAYHLRIAEQHRKAHQIKKETRQ